MRIVTFHLLQRRTITLVRRTSIIFVLILVLATSACVTGWGSQQTDSCVHPSARQCCGRKSSRIATGVGVACRPVLKALPDKCSMRSFIPFQFVALHATQASAPLQPAGYISPAFDSVIIFSSIGPPETDRGPPRS
jgi:hypothetical protein